MSKIIEKLNKKNICFLGLGIEHEAMLNYLWKQGLEADITICDSRPKEALHGRIDNLPPINVKFILGKDYDKSLEQFDVIFRVPGYPLHKTEIRQAIKAGVEVTSITKLFLQNSPTKNIIAVTGTKGKGTTSGLIVKIISTAGKSVYWGGNIGVPIFDFYEKLQSDDMVVLELSSFQLEDIDVSPHIAVITNIFPEHLQAADPNNPNYHKSFKVYCNSKLGILAYQSARDYAVLNSSIKKQCLVRGKIKVNLGRANKIFFEKKEIVSRLAGEYNKENIGAAYEVGKILGIRDSIIRKGIKNFKGLPHRLELVREKDGVKYYDNSFATTPESTMADIFSFTEDKIIIIGGADKGADFSGLANAIKKNNVKKAIILPGEGSNRIIEELNRVEMPGERMILADNLNEAVSKAHQSTHTGDVVLLSTACASFGLFKNYYERGEKFKAEVLKL